MTWEIFVFYHITTGICGGHFVFPKSQIALGGGITFIFLLYSRTRTFKVHPWQVMKAHLGAVLHLPGLNPLLRGCTTWFLQPATLHWIDCYLGRSLAGFSLVGWP